MDSASKSRVLYENLDTSFVNLWALLRYLSRRSFVGRVHVELDGYTADVFLTGSNTPLVHEVDRAAGTDKLEEAALHRVVLRARESSGSISVFEGADEAMTPQSGAAVPKTEALHVSAVESPAKAAPEPAEKSEGTASVTAGENAAPSVTAEPTEKIEWTEVVKASGELIGGIERALTGAGADFPSLFSAARLELADDYTFLDPTSGIQYSKSNVTTREELPVNLYVAGLSEVLRRVVDRVATGSRARRVRERVALELSLVARKRREGLQRSGFLALLDRIAGTKVI